MSLECALAKPSLLTQAQFTDEGAIFYDLAIDKNRLGPLEVRLSLIGDTKINLVAADLISSGSIGLSLSKDSPVSCEAKSNCLFKFDVTEKMTVSTRLELPLQLSYERMGRSKILKSVLVIVPQSKSL